MSEECRPPEPTPEHALLQEGVGSWTVACKFFMGPDQPPMEAAGTDEVEALGPFSTLSTFRCDFGGMPFEGRCAVGYDPKKGKYYSTWMDQMSPYMIYSEGEFDEAGKVLTMKGQAPSMATGELVDHEIIEEHLAPNHRFVKMFVDGAQTFEMTYTR